MAMLVLCAQQGPGRRVPCARCGELVVLDPFFGPDQRSVCPPCASAEMSRALEEGQPIPRLAAKPAAIEALRLFLAPTSGVPS